MGVSELLDFHLSQGVSYDSNTPEQSELVNKFLQLFTVSKSARDKDEKANPQNIRAWRKAYEGVLSALKGDELKNGILAESDVRSKQLRKLAFELVETQIDNNIPKPKIIPHYKTDLYAVNATEAFLSYKIGESLAARDNDRNERAKKTDGTYFFMMAFDPKDSKYNRNGQIKFKGYLSEQIVPQPGLLDFYDSKYVFVEETVPVYDIKLLFGKNVIPTANGIAQTKTSLTTTEIVTCYYINERGIVGRFIWALASAQFIAHDEDWQIRKVRQCQNCKEIQPVQDKCEYCGSKSFKYVTGDEEILTEDIVMMYNPYEVNETEDENAEPVKVVVAKAGERIPHYRLTRLPFVICTNVSTVDSIYGLSDVKIVLEMQDTINKLLTRAEEKMLMIPAANVYEPAKLNIRDDNKVVRRLKLTNANDRNLCGIDQIQISIQQDLQFAEMLYQSARNSLGITDSYQGKRDNTAESGKAKEISAAQAAGRLESKRVMKAIAFAEMYKLMFQYLLAFSDDPIKFVKVNPDGKKVEAVWSKHMFIRKNPETGALYYEDDFVFDVDGISALSTTDKISLIKQDFLNGAFGIPAEARVRKLYWNILSELGYPLAQNIIAGIEDQEQHLPEEIEQLLMANPEVLQTALGLLQNGQQNQGGQRQQPGQPRQTRSQVGAESGATHSTNIERTNERNRAKAGVQ